jgi:outer membrane protein TolC
VIIARIRHDIALTDFEEGVRDMMLEVEDLYWELYFSYRDLDARKIGRDSALETWRKVQALKGVGTQGGEADKEAQARSQYFLFRSQVESALTNLFRIENRLRYKMGLTATDSRLIRPIDEPTTAQVEFDWASVHLEALTRRTELRNQKWQIKRRELELVATKNNLMPRLDVGGTYRWLGAGHALIDTPDNVTPFQPGSSAWDVLESGDYQEWQLGVQFNMAIGNRNGHTGVRHHQLLLARERAVLEDLELTVSHQMSEVIRDIDFNYLNTQSNFNRRVASQDEVDAVRTVYESGRVPIDLLLDAQRRRAEAESAYYRSLVDYNRAIMRVHFRKGSLLEYNGVYLAEGPWPGKAQFDALRRARQRDASTFIDYGYTRPNVISRGPVGQFIEMPVGNYESVPTPAPQGTQAPGNQLQEAIPIPQPTEYQPTDGPINPTSGEASIQDIDLANLPVAEDDFSYGFAEASALPTAAATVAQVGYTSEPAPSTVIIAPSTPLNTSTAAPTTTPPSTPLAPSTPTSTSTPDNPFRNPNRADFSQWIDSTTRGVPGAQTLKSPTVTPANPFSSVPAGSQPSH